MAVEIQLARDEVTPALRRLLREATGSSGLSAVLGRAGRNVLVAHFRERNQTPNRLGGKRTNFWSRVAESVDAPRVEGRGIIIRVAHPAIGQKVHGGTIVPRKAKALAIPVAARAHGLSPRSIPGLIFIPSQGGQSVGFLALRNAGNLQFLFVLKKSVTQAPDPLALPPGRDVGAALERAGLIYIRRRAGG